MQLMSAPPDKFDATYLYVFSPPLLILESKEILRTVATSQGLDFDSHLYNMNDKIQTEETVDEKHGTVLDTVKQVTQTEHELGFWKGAKLYPKAVFWSAFFCIAVIMAGFDPQLVSSFYALPAFQKKYGQLYEVEYIISAPWQTGLGMGNAVGQLVGALACGWPLERFGRKRTLAACCCWSIAWIFMQFFSSNLTILCIGEIFAGLGYGFYVVIAPVYASDVCPLALRGVLTASVNLAFVIGQFIAQGTAAGVEGRTDALAYKIPFGTFTDRPAIYRHVADESCSNSMGLACNPFGRSLLRS